jgi:hypothetical protein
MFPFTVDGKPARNQWNDFRTQKQHVHGEINRQVGAYIHSDYGIY